MPVKPKVLSPGNVKLRDMQNNKKIDRKVLDALESIDGIQRAEPQPWFFTRVQARLRAEQRTIWETAGNFLSRPVVALAGILLILVMNVTVMTSGGEKRSGIGGQNDVVVTESESIIATTSSFDYEKISQE
jgi:hypothetical protein